METRRPWETHLGQSVGDKRESRCLRWVEGGASHARPVCGIWEHEDPSPHGGKICLPSSGSLAALSPLTPTLPSPAESGGVDGPAGLCHLGFNPPECWPWGSWWGGFCPWLVEPPPPPAPPPPPSMADEQEGPSLPGPGSWEEKGWRKQGPCRLSRPSPTPDKNSPRVPGPPHPPLSHGRVPAQLLFLLPGAPFPEGLRVQLGLGPVEQMLLPTPGAGRRLSLLRDGRDAAGSSGSRVGGLGWHVRGRSCKPRRGGEGRGGPGGCKGTPTQAAGSPGRSRQDAGPTHLQGCRRGVPPGRVDTGVQDRWVGT